MNPVINIGCSAVDNQHWINIFYPKDLPRSKWFEYYCQYFETYEINGSFYKFPTKRSLSSWYAKSPEGFRFSVKAPKSITHIDKFSDSAQIREFYNACRDGLRKKFACVLFQLPASFRYEEEKLKLILQNLDPSYNNVVEFRHESWWRRDVYDALADKNIVFCNVSYPALPENLVVNSTLGYIRLHGTPDLFYSGYSQDYLHGLLKSVKIQFWDEVFIYFNNTASEYGILNAMEMEELNFSTQ